MLVVSKTKSKGRGVFAKKRFIKGETVQVVPVIVIPPEQVDLIEQTIIGDYYYNWENESAAIALGLVSIINHSYQPNTYYTKRFDEGEIEYIALREIEVGEEITANYKGCPDDRSPVWFESVEEVCSIVISENI